MKWLIYVLTGLLVAVATGMFLSADPGQVILVLQDQSIQTSLGFFVLLIITGFVIFYMVLRTINNLIDVPQNYRRWKQYRRHRKSEYHLTQGLLALTAADWQTAEKLLVKGASCSSLPMINYIVAARAAQQQGKIEKRDHYLRLAHTKGRDSSAYAVEITQAELQLAQQQTEQAYATLRHLDSTRPGIDQVRVMLLEASSELKDWQQSLILLQELERKGAMPIEKIRARQLQVYAGILNAAGKTGNISDLKEAWKAVPKKLKKDLYLLEVYVTARLAYADTADCEALLREAIKSRPDTVLVRLYGLVEGPDPRRQLAFVERLLSSSINKAVLQLSIGRLCKRLGLWGKAKASLDESLRISPAADAYYELASLLEGQGETALASQNYREGLALTVGRFTVAGADSRKTLETGILAGDKSRYQP